MKMTQLTALGLSIAMMIMVACTRNNGSDKNKDKKDNTVDTEEDNNTLLIDDCDDGDAKNLLGGDWLSYDDFHDMAGGESEVWPTSWFKDGQFSMSNPGYGDKGYAARIKGTTADKLGWDFVGMAAALGPDAFCPEPTPTEVDLVSYSGIRFMAKGTSSGGALTVKIIHTKDGKEDNCKENGLTGDTLTNWTDYNAEFTDQLQEDWTEIKLNFREDFKGPADVDIETVLLHAKDLHFFFQSTNGGEIDLTVDDLSLYREEEVLDTDTGTGTDHELDFSGDPESFESLEENEANPVFDRSEVVAIRVTLPPKEWDALKESATLEQYTPADVTIMGESFENVGFRFKGAYGSLYHCFDDDGNCICDKLPLKIKFNEYVEEQRFKGLKRINLQSMRHDRTKIRECLAYDLYREMGIVSPRCSYADVYVNDEHLGLFGLVEQIDGRFTDSRFSKGDGNLYKEAWPHDADRWYFDQRMKTNKEVADHRAFMEFAKEMSEANDETLPNVLKQWMDIDYFTRYMAVDFAIANWDGITTFYCGLTWACGNHNFYMYQEEERPFFWVIPWDLEATFNVDHWLGSVEPWNELEPKCEDIPMMPGSTDTYIRPAGCDQTLRAFALSERSLYEKYLKVILKNHMDKESILEKINDLTELIEPYIETDDTLDPESWQSEVEWQITEMNRLRERIENELK